MTVNFDAAKASGTTALLDRRAAGARQDRWMLELERAGIATRAAKEGQVKPDLTQEKPASADPRASADARLARAADAKRADAVAQARPAGQPPQEAQQAQQPQQVQQPQHEDAALTAGPLRRAVQAHPARAGLRAGAPLMASVSCEAPSTFLPQGAAAVRRGVGAAPAGMAPPAFHAHADSAMPEAQLLVASDTVDAPPASDDAPLAGAAPALPEQTDNAAFDKRLLHLYVGDDGVHAWLRDAQLQGHGARAVAQALAEQVAATGKPLAGLSINGKPVAMGDYAERDAALSSPSDLQEAWMPVLTTYSSIKKGNS